MSGSRQWVLAGVLALVGLLTATVLVDVLGTVFFAISGITAPVEPGPDRPRIGSKPD